MTVVCNSWSLACKEQGNSLFLSLSLFRALCSPHADTHTHLTHRKSQRQADPQTTSVCKGANYLSSVNGAQAKRGRKRNSLQRDEGVH